MASWEFDSSSETRQPHRRRRSTRPAWLAVAALALLATALAPAAAPESEQDWTHYVRIAAWPLTATNAPAIIRERVRLIQGELTIDSKPGRGARIEVRVPELQAALSGV